MAKTCTTDGLNKANRIKQTTLLACLLTTLYALAQPPQPIARINGTLEPGYFFMVPFKMSNRHAADFTYLMVLNEKAELVYYKKVKAASDFKMHPNGRISYFARDKFFIFDKSLHLLDSVACINGAGTDPHDFLILNNGHYLLLGWEEVIEDCSNKRLFLHNGSTGSKKARVKYGLVQELNSNKELVYEWKSRESHRVEKADPYFLTDTANVDLTHFNSLDVDNRGNFIISARYFNEVIKVERATGKVLWCFGGKNNTVKVLNDTLPFYGQHDARVVSNSRMTLFDNGYTASERRHNARAIEYEINDAKKTAKVIRTYSNNQYTISKGTGNVQKLKGGKLLVNYGQVENGTPNTSFEIVNTAGKKLIEVHFNDTIGTYRAFFYDKLRCDAHQCKIQKTTAAGSTYLQVDSPHKLYIWNTGETDAKIHPLAHHNYYVFVSDDGETFIRSEKFEFN